MRAKTASSKTKVGPTKESGLVSSLGDEKTLAAQTIDHLLARAIKSGATDVHIEPRTELIVVRYRIDGLLREVHKLPFATLTPLVAELKTRSNLKQREHHAPQEGSFSYTTGSASYEILTTTLPIIDGEKITLHIRNQSKKVTDLRSLGLWGQALRDVQYAIAQPHGIMLAVGPLGSGTSTTIASALTALSRPSVSIATIEDSIEYQIAGANQTLANPKAGLTLTTGLAALLRQDPNIVMVSRIADTATAHAVVQAAVTGHVVFSALHAPSAANGIARLVSMGVDSFSLAAVLRIVVAQRLVRRLCSECRESFTPNSASLKNISNVLGIDSIGGFAHVHQLEIAARHELSQTDTAASAIAATALSSSSSSIHRLWREHRGGCASCNHTGYDGRIGIFEVLPSAAAVQKSIANKDSADSIAVSGIAAGMVPLRIDGLIKSLLGITTLDEVVRVAPFDR